MSTPEKPRPSLDDTLHHIDTVLADDEDNRCDITHITRDNGGFSSSRCPNQAVPGLHYCQAHTDRYGVNAKPGAPAELLPELEQKLLDAAIRDVTGPEEPPDFATINEQRAEVGLPPIPAPLFAPIPPARPGWLARALHRLFGSDT